MAKEFPVFCESERFITVFLNSATGSYPESVTPSPRSLSLTFILTLCFHLCLSCTRDILRSDFPTKIFYAFLTAPIRAIYPPISPWFHHPNHIWQTVHILKLITVQFSASSWTCPLFRTVDRVTSEEPIQSFDLSVRRILHHSHSCYIPAHLSLISSP
jgi:hypothetical protein